jgi:hypothetical protein
MELSAAVTAPPALRVSSPPPVVPFTFAKSVAWLVASMVSSADDAPLVPE